MNNAVPWIFGLVVVWIVTSRIYAGYRQVTATPTIVCTACGTQGLPQRATPGSILVELALWLCFIIPGLVYSLWRISARHSVCGACGSRQIVPINSPAGKELTLRFPRA